MSIKGFIHSEKESSGNIPEAVRWLSPGIHNVSIEEHHYRALVAEREGANYFMLFDTDTQLQHEAEFFGILIGFTLVMTLASAGVGFWLAIRIVAPVTRLVEQVSQAEPDMSQLPLAKLVGDDEVGELARAFERYVQRLGEFMEREKNFTGDVSHELRTPLAVIMGAVEVLEQDASLSGIQRMRLIRIKRAVHDMIDMTRALLLMSRERLAGADEPLCYVATIVKAAVEKHRHLLSGRPVKLMLDLHAEPSLQVEQALLEIAVSNLLRNAMFHTQTGTIRLVLNKGSLVVSDTGVGMNSDERARVFDRHYKGQQSAGFGVGLSLVKRICERYGWHINIDSAAGVGTTVIVDFIPGVVF
ncbi:MAG: HAMP domain-containing histidine kinase [Gammaproteobacteria bacterium]|nr:HAMP domain-containing histidine kinase [Gammaproteobacteria bacterium]MBU1446793.1 HAMP domain-containing histidine kinase [Gammaproteobacteria bacterium]